MPDRQLLQQTVGVAKQLWRWGEQYPASGQYGVHLHRYICRCHLSEGIISPDHSNLSNLFCSGAPYLVSGCSSWKAQTWEFTPNLADTTC